MSPVLKHLRRKCLDSAQKLMQVLKKTIPLKRSYFVAHAMVRIDFFCGVYCKAEVNKHRPRNLQTLNKQSTQKFVAYLTKFSKTFFKTSQVSSSRVLTMMHFTWLASLMRYKFPCLILQCEYNFFHIFFNIYIYIGNDFVATCI